MLPPAQVYFFARGNPLSIRMITRQPHLFPQSLFPDFPKTLTSTCQTFWLLSAAFVDVLTKWQQQKPRLTLILSRCVFCSHWFLVHSLAHAFSWHQADPLLQGNFSENSGFFSVYIFCWGRKRKLCHPRCRPAAIRALIHPEICFWGVVQEDDALLCAGWKELPSLGLETG